MTMELNINKQCIYKGELRTAVGYAGKLYKLEDGEWAPSSQCDFDVQEQPARKGTEKLTQFITDKITSSLERSRRELVGVDEGSTRVYAIIDVLPSIPKSRYSRKTKEPGLKAISEAVGFDVTDEERDAAWAIYNA